MMTHIISELPESYKKIVENPKDKLDEIYNPMTQNVNTEHDRIC